jgi:hypothetical protein
MVSVRERSGRPFYGHSRWQERNDSPFWALWVIVLSMERIFFLLSLFFSFLPGMGRGIPQRSEGEAILSVFMGRA